MADQAYALPLARANRQGDLTRTPGSILSGQYLAEGLKDEATGKGTSAAEMTSTGVWGTRDPRESTAERGQAATESLVIAAVAFIERWNELRPPGTGVR